MIETLKIFDVMMQGKKEDEELNYKMRLQLLCTNKNLI